MITKMRLLLFSMLVASQLGRGLAVSRELLLCKQTAKFNVSLRYSDTLIVQANSSYCNSANTLNSYNVRCVQKLESC